MKTPERILMTFHRVKGGYIVATSSLMDGTRKMDWGSINVGMVLECPGLYEKWKSLVYESIREMVARTGGSVASITEYKPHELN